MRKVVEYVFLAVVFAGFGAVLAWNFAGHSHGEAGEAHGGGEAAESAEHEGEPPAKVSRDERGRAELELAEGALKLLGLETQKIQKSTRPAEVIAYGLLQEDAASGFVLRAPLAGVLFAADAQPWPAPGEVLKSAAEIGTIQPRFGPAERIALLAQSAAARGAVAEAAVALDAARLSYDSKRELHKAEAALVSARTLEEAAAKVKTEESRLAAARETIAFLDAATASQDSPAGRLPLRIEQGGQVVELLARPGEAVESGQPILRIGQFDQLIARIEIPPGEAGGLSPKTARIAPIGDESRLLAATRIVSADPADGRPHGRVLLCTIDASGTDLRPGLPVTAYLESGGEPQAGFVLPGAAVLRYSGATWVYVREDTGEFVRYEVTLEYPVAGGWFAIGDLEDGAAVVTVGAGTLLSAELMAAGGGEEEEE